MAEKINVVLVGDNELSIILPFVNELKASSCDINFSVYNPYHVSGVVNENSLNSFSTVYKLNAELTYTLTAAQLFTFLLKENNCYKYIKAFIKGVLTLQLDKELNFILSDYKYHLFWQNELKKYNIIHHQTLFEPQIDLLRIAKQENKKVIVSFWGSDLLNTFEISKIKKQADLLSYADVITVQSDDMRAVVSNKFGKENEIKTEDVLFGIPFKSLKSIIDYRERYLKEKSKLVVQVGYNSSPTQNHIKIITALNMLPQSIRNRIQLVIPMGYGDGDQEYIYKVKQISSEHFSNIILNTAYLSQEDYLKRAASIDLFINMPETDAGNATIYETLLFGTQVITGSWLPYSNFKKNNINLKTIDSFQELTFCVEEFVNNNKELDDQIEKKVLGMISYNIVAKRWLSIYGKMLI